MFERVKSVTCPFSAVGAPWDSLSVPINTQPLHPGYIISVIVRRRFGWDADDERENSH